MAKISFNIPVDNMTGALDSNHKFIQRQKHLHDTFGIEIHTCPTEAYIVANPRDYKRNPPTGAELAHLQHFGKAAKRTASLLSTLKSDTLPTDEQLQQIENYRQRFQAQLHKQPDPQAPLDRNGKKKHYYRFDNFVRAMIYQEMKNE